MLADGEASLQRQEIESGPDCAASEIIHGVGNEIGDYQSNRARGQDLIENRADAPIVPHSGGLARLRAPGIAA